VPDKEGQARPAA